MIAPWKPESNGRDSVAAVIQARNAWSIPFLGDVGHRAVLPQVTRYWVLGTRLSLAIHGKMGVTVGLVRGLPAFNGQI